MLRTSLLFSISICLSPCLSNSLTLSLSVSGSIRVSHSLHALVKRVTRGLIDQLVLERKSGPVLLWAARLLDFIEEFTQVRVIARRGIPMRVMDGADSFTFIVGEPAPDLFLGR